MLNMSSFKYVTRNTVNTALKINENIELEEHVVQDQTYFKIKNIFVDPEAAIEYLQNWPVLAPPDYTYTPGGRQNFTPIDVAPLVKAYAKIADAINSVEEFSLEHIAWDGSDWSKAEYIRSGDPADLSGKEFLQLSEAASNGRNAHCRALFNKHRHRIVQSHQLSKRSFEGEIDTPFHVASPNIFSSSCCFMFSVCLFDEIKKLT